MTRKREPSDLYETIQSAAREGRGLYLSPAEAQLLAAQPFVHLDASLLRLVWKPVIGFERYEVSEHGHVRRGLKLLKQTRSKSGHMNVTIYNTRGEQWRVGVHTLVAGAFCGMSPPGKPFGCHINGHPDDNRETNIYWGSREDNIADMKRHAREGKVDRFGKSVDSRQRTRDYVYGSNA